jgi:hypothetical protein
MSKLTVEMTKDDFKKFLNKHVRIWVGDAFKSTVKEVLDGKLITLNLSVHPDLLLSDLDLIIDKGDKRNIKFDELVKIELYS